LPQSFCLARDGDVDLAFEGVELAHASSRAPQDTRWEDLRLYRTSTRRYVLEEVHHSLWPGESEAHFAKVYDAPPSVLDELRGRRSLDHAAVDLIRQAAQLDSGFVTVAAEWI
jgi:EXLDI family protein